MAEIERKQAPDGGNALCVVGAEALFVALPFVITGLALAERGELAQLPYMPAWSMAASALIGLSMVRFAAGLLQAKSEIEGLAWERVLVMFAAIIVFALMPSLLVLSLALRAAHSVFVAVAQFVLFSVGMFLYLSLGWLAQRLMAGEASQDQKRELTVISAARVAGD